MESVTYKIKVIKEKITEQVITTTSAINTYYSTIQKPFNIGEKVEKDSQIILICIGAIVVIGSIIICWDYVKTKKLVYANEGNNIYTQKEENKPDEIPNGKTVEIFNTKQTEEKNRKGKHF